MAKFFKINTTTSKVVDIIEADNEYISSLDDHSLWIEYTNEHFNAPKVGWTYVINGRYFKGEQPYPSWTFNHLSLQWEPPVPYPDPAVHGITRWDEETQTWKKHYTTQEVVLGLADDDEDYMTHIGRIQE